MCDLDFGVEVSKGVFVRPIRGDDKIPKGAKGATHLTTYNGKFVAVTRPSIIANFDGRGERVYHWMAGKDAAWFPVSTNVGFYK